MFKDFCDFSVVHIVMAVFAILGICPEDDFDPSDPNCIYDDGLYRFYVFHITLRDDYYFPEERFTEQLRKLSKQTKFRPQLCDVEYYDSLYLRNFSSIYITVYLDANADIGQEENSS